jgi:hypothetical protein
VLIKRLEGYGPADELLDVVADAATEIMARPRKQPSKPYTPAWDRPAEHPGD